LATVQAPDLCSEIENYSPEKKRYESLCRSRKIADFCAGDLGDLGRALGFRVHRQKADIAARKPVFGLLSLKP
jgi:hypothetical protein